MPGWYAWIVQSRPNGGGFVGVGVLLPDQGGVASLRCSDIRDKDPSLAALPERFQERGED